MSKAAPHTIIDAVRANLRRLTPYRSARRYARAAGLSDTGIQAILSGRVDNPGVGTLAAIADALGVPLAELLSDAGTTKATDAPASGDAFPTMLGDQAHCPVTAAAA